jgi:hypothetical protein
LGVNQVGIERDEFYCRGFDFGKVAAAEAVDWADIFAIDPSCLPHLIRKGPKGFDSDRILGSRCQADEDTDRRQVPRLLRSRRYRSRNRSATQNRDKLSPFHYCPNRRRDRSNSDTRLGRAGPLWVKSRHSTPLCSQKQTWPVRTRIDWSSSQSDHGWQRPVRAKNFPAVSAPAIAA